MDKIDSQMFFRQIEEVYQKTLTQQQIKKLPIM